MGTSHQEPMARNTPEWSQYGEGDWNFTKNTETLHDFWVYGAERAKGYETMFTVGMRGNGDLPLPGANVPIMESESTPRSIYCILIIRHHGCSTRYPQDDLWYSGYIVNTTSLGNVQGSHGVLCKWHDCARGWYVFVRFLCWCSVIELLAEDNWGNLVAVLPWGDNHTAGGGIYYHADCESTFYNLSLADM